jgi:hypothetical protein
MHVPTPNVTAAAIPPSRGRQSAAATGSAGSARLIEEPQDEERPEAREQTRGERGRARRQQGRDKGARAPKANAREPPVLSRPVGELSRAPLQAAPVRGKVSGR